MKNKSQLSTKRFKRTLNYLDIFKKDIYLFDFFIQSLPNDLYFVAKAGWTSKSRGETAYIASSDRNIQYILTIFAEDRSYAYNWDIFPEMSHLVFNDMKARNNIK